MSKTNRITTKSLVSCPKCHEQMEKRQHKVILSKHTNAPFYYNRWYYCKECKRMQSYEEDKVWNNNERALQYLQYVELRQQTFQDYKNIMRDSTK